MLSIRVQRVASWYARADSRTRQRSKPHWSKSPYQDRDSSTSEGSSSKSNLLSTTVFIPIAHCFLTTNKISPEGWSKFCYVWWRTNNWLVNVQVSWRSNKSRGLLPYSLPLPFPSSHPSFSLAWHANAQRAFSCPCNREVGCERICVHKFGYALRYTIFTHDVEAVLPSQWSCARFTRRIHLQAPNIVVATLLSNIIFSLRAVKLGIIFHDSKINCFPGNLRETQ